MRRPRARRQSGPEGDRHPHRPFPPQAVQVGRGGGLQFGPAVRLAGKPAEAVEDEKNDLRRRGFLEFGDQVQVGHMSFWREGAQTRAETKGLYLRWLPVWRIMSFRAPSAG